MNKHQRRKQAAQAERAQKLAYLQFTIDSMFYDPKGLFISNLIPMALRHLKISCAVPMVIALIVVIVFLSGQGAFNPISAVFFYLVMLLLTLLALAVILLVLIALEGVAKQLTSMLLYEKPYEDGTELDELLASFLKP